MHRTKAKPKAYPETPGPRNCLRTNGNTRACETCGCTPAVLHTPIRAAGRFCATCCPHCGPPKQPKNSEELQWR
jgi:hypothetical protein